MGSLKDASKMEIKFDTKADMSGVSKDISEGQKNSKKDLTQLIDTIGNVGDAVAGLRAGMEIAQKALAFLGRVAGSAAKRMTELNRASALGVMTKDAKALTTNLGGVLSQMESVREASSLALAGFQGQEGKVAQLARTISFVTGATKEAALEQVKSGQVSEEFLNQIGRTSVQVENAIKAASVKVGRELTEIERRRVVFGYVSQGLGNIHKQAAALDKISPVQSLQANLKSAGDTILNDLSPELVRLSDGFNKSLPDIINFVKGGLASLRALAKGASEIWDFVSKKINAVMSALPKFVTKGLKLAFDPLGLIDKAKKGLVDVRKLTGVQVESVKKAVKAGAEGLGKALVTLRKKRHGKMLGASLKSEILDELKGFQTESREIIRNYTANFLDALSNLGGPISGIFSALKDGPELFRKFSTVVPAKVLAANLNLTTKQIEEMRKAGKLTEKQAKLQTILNLRLKGGVVDLREYVNNEKIVNVQLKAGLSLFEAQNKIAAIQVEKLNQQKDVKANILLFERGIYSFAKKQDPINQRIAAFLRSGLASYKQLSKVRTRLLNISMIRANLEKEAEVRAKKFARDDARVDAEQRLLSLQKEINAQRGTQTQTDVFKAGAADRIREIQKGIRDMSAEADLLSKKLAAGAFADQASQELAKAQVAAIRERIGLRSAEIDKVHELKNAQIESISTLGTFMQQARTQVSGFAQQLGQQLYQGVQGGVQGIGGIVSSTMESLVSGVGDAGANAGKLFLDVLAGAAAQLGAFYITAGIAAAFIPPYTGAGSIAGGLGLLALSGTLKGIGSLVGASASRPSVGGGGSVSLPAIGSPPTPRSGIPGQERGTQQQSVQFVFASVPSDIIKVDRPGTARALKKFGVEVARDYGIRPFDSPRAFVGRGR